MLYKLIISTACILMLLACSKNSTDKTFRGADKVFFVPVQNADSLFYSFANFPAAAEKDTFLELQIMGNLAAQPRSVQVKVDPGATTALPEEYEIGKEIFIPANSIKGRLPLKLKVSPRLESSRAVLSLQLQSSADLAVDPEKPGKINELVRFRVVFTNVLTQPADWPVYWGAYSKVKHRLVIDLTGYSVYSGVNWNTSLETKVTGICNQWLEQYNANHPGAPYSNETGMAIRFCQNCN